jgi:hypothetical protein
MIRNHRGLALVALSTVAAMISSACSGQAQTAPILANNKADHHMHIVSPNLATAVSALCAKLGPGQCPPDTPTTSSSGDEVVRALDEAKIRWGVLLSPGYIFTIPEIGGLKPDTDKLVRAENAYNVDQAKLHCGRLLAFISVNPFSPGAVEEIVYWGQRGGVTGLKVHLEVSDFNFQSRDHVKKLAAIFAAAAQQHFPIIIHIATAGKGSGDRNAIVFANDILPHAAGNPVQIAHAAGGGGAGPKNAIKALSVFANISQAKPELTSNLYFDLSGAVPDEKWDKRTTAKFSKSDLDNIKSFIYKIGLKRFLPATDWTMPLDISKYFVDQNTTFKWTEAENELVMTNIAPYVPNSNMKNKCIN